MTSVGASSLPRGNVPEGALWFKLLDATANMTQFLSRPVADIDKRRHSGEPAGAAETTGSPVQADFGTIVPREAYRLIERIELKLEEDREEAEQLAETPPSPHATTACLRLAQRLAPHLALAVRLKWGAFTEEDGGVSLVVQSLVTDRRVNCRIDRDGSSVSAIRIDEHMHVETTVTPPDEARPKELAAWVTSRV